MSLEDDIGFLDRIPTLHVLGWEALRIVAISVESVHVRAGDVLFEEGEPADAGYVLVNGSIVFRSTSDKSGIASHIAKPGTLIGETALIVDTRRPATATALEHSLLWRITRGVFLRILEGEPAAASALRRVIAARVEEALSELDLVAPRFEAEFRPAEEEQG